MFLYFYTIANHLWFGLSLLLILFFIFSRTKVFKDSLINNTLHILTTLTFTILAIISSYWGFFLHEGLFNTAPVFIIAVGFLFGKFSGTFCGCIVGLHFFLHMLNTESLLLAFIYMGQGYITGLLSSWLRHKDDPWLHVTLIGLLLASAQVILMAFVSDRNTTIPPVLEDFALPFMFTVAIGSGFLMFIVQDASNSHKKLEGISAKIALDIASDAASILQKGFNKDTAQEVIKIITSKTDNFSVMAITSRKNLLDFYASQDEQFFLNYLNADLQILLRDALQTDTKDLAVIRSYQAVPLQDNNSEIGYILFAHIAKDKFSTSEIDLANAIGNMISTQIKINQIKERANLLANAEIRALQAQINPHFLFNALNTISYYCTPQPQMAKKLITYLADYYRKNLADANTLISFREELQHVHAYISIEKARFEDRLRVDYQIDEDCFFHVPALILQPLVENAVKHGIAPKTNGGKIVIKLKKKKYFFYVFVIDNGVGIDKSKLTTILADDTKRKSIGLCNVHKRLLSIYGPDNTLHILSQKDKGTVVYFKIPVEEVKIDND